jgi:hypothetical protein
MHMVNTSSLPGVAGVSFDLDSKEGVMQVLAAVRASDLDAAARNDLRDLVFLYSNGGKEPTVRRALEQKIQLHKLVPPPPKVTAQPLPPPPTIGKFRSAPTFSVPTPVVVEKAKEPEASFAANPVWKRPEPVASEPVPEQTPTPTQTPVTVPTPEPVTPVVDVPPFVVPDPVVESTPVVPPPPPSPAPAAASAPGGDNDIYLARIREIKALVNEKVGNPVNLVDINNEVGREYMAALLDAMKKLNGGTSAASAMKRLENAYAAVEETLKNRGNVAPVIEPLMPTSAPQQHPQMAPVIEEEVPVDVSAPARAVDVPVYANTSPVDLVPAPEPYIPPAPAPEPIKAPVFTPPPPSEPLYQPPAPPEPVAYQVPITQVPPSAPKVTMVEPLGAPAPVPPKPLDSQVSYFASLADFNEKPNPTQTAPKPAAPMPTTTASGDPLFSAEVDDGLQQLLVEWSIFKKSGLFGTGPKGREHPLFKKMAPLQIPLLLAGRFEGATQEIKQSVTDYMNGWRYEQGIIYQQNEAFEHYLRRVIRHILDLQRGK